MTHPVEWLPRVASTELKAFIADQSVRELSEVPDHLLNALQKRVRDCTVAGNAYFDALGAESDLAGHGLPGLFLDFETISFAVPIWPGTRPYQRSLFSSVSTDWGPRERLPTMPFSTSRVRTLHAVWLRISLPAAAITNRSLFTTPDLKAVAWPNLRDVTRIWLQAFWQSNGASWICGQ